MKFVLFLLLVFPLAWAVKLAGEPAGTAYMAIQSDGQVYGWGHNWFGKVGVGSSGSSVFRPTKVLNVFSASDVAVGMYHSCIVDQGKAKCAGYGDFLGRRSTTSDSAVMVNVEGLDEAGPISRVFCHSEHSCLLTAAGAVWCWGSNSFGQLANPLTAGESIPGKVTGYGADKVAVAVATGLYHTCILIEDGTVGCAGRNDGGQLGIGSEVDQPILMQVQGELANVVSISAGHLHTCAVTQDGKLRCWGQDLYEQLSLPTSSGDKTVPTVVPGISGAAEVECGLRNTFVILQNSHSVMGFGDNNYGAMIAGGKPETIVDPAILYDAQSGIVTVAGGYASACILLESGQVKCLGADIYGSLGRSGTAPSYNPLGLVEGIPITSAPTVSPTLSTPQPTKPTKKPTSAPTTKPTRLPTATPTKKPTAQPTMKGVTREPTSKPSKSPSPAPTKKPSKAPTVKPTKKPTSEPTTKPSKAPTVKPTKKPSKAPTPKPTKKPTSEPTTKPSKSPSPAPTKKPSKAPTVKPTKKPTFEPTTKPTKAPVEQTPGD